MAHKMFYRIEPRIGKYVGAQTCNRASPKTLLNSFVSFVISYFIIRLRSTHFIESKNQK